MSSFPRPDSLTDRIARGTFVRTLEVHDEIVSTNDRGMALAANEEVRRPCLIFARRQTGGRGRGANRWWAGEGALTFSLLMSPDPDHLPASRWPELSLTAGAAVCEALRLFVPESADVRLKWPNDVYVSGRKISGILIEVPKSAGGDVIVGIGINVNNGVAAAPLELQSKAISLCDLVGKTVSAEDVLIGVLQSLERHFELLVSAPEEMQIIWRRYDFLVGRHVTVGDAHETVSGTCEGIADDGSLWILTIAGPRRLYGGVVQSYE